MNADCAPASPAASHRVLVVDDDELIRETVKELLEIEGFEVSTAEHGQAALDSIVTQGPPCFVLLDLMMPVMDGWTFLEELRKRPGVTRPDLPIVVFSALSEAASLATRYRCEVLPKPVDIDSLIDVAKRHCGLDC